MSVTQSTNIMTTVVTSVVHDSKHGCVVSGKSKLEWTYDSDRQDCCEHAYVHILNDIELLKSATKLCMVSVSNEHVEDYGINNDKMIHRVLMTMLIYIPSREEVTFSILFGNVHNGYYGHPLKIKFTNGEGEIQRWSFDL